jgi:hypothetical protein
VNLQHLPGRFAVALIPALGSAASEFQIAVVADGVRRMDRQDHKSSLASASDASRAQSSNNVLAAPSSQASRIGQQNKVGCRFDRAFRRSMKSKDSKAVNKPVPGLHQIRHRNSSTFNIFVW